MIIGLSGYAKSGKDTVAEMILDIQPDSNWQIKKFSGKLKQIASILTGVPADKFEDQDFKQSMLGPSWSRMVINSHLNVEDKKMSVREFLQRLGTDAIRDGLHPNAWVNALMADYRSEEVVEKLSDFISKVTPPSNWIVTDCRFPNEAQAIKDKGGIIVRIDRTGVSPVNAHPSETSLDNWDFDYKIANVSDLVSLRQTVEVLLNKIS
jgi:hypothetical protein